MADTEFEKYYGKIHDCYDYGTRGTGADKLKFLLIPIVCVATFGFPTVFGSYVKVLCQFAAPAFYILCGFFMYGKDDEDRLQRMKKGIKRSALMFVPMFIVFLGINAAYFYFAKGVNVFPTLLGKRKLFEIFVLSYWPFDMGATIWFIQDLFYAYVFFVVLQKLKLFKYYKVIMVISMLASLFFGEFARVIHFNFLGYNYIPIGFLTCTLPFMLLGAFFRENAKLIFNIPKKVYYILVPVGIFAAFWEMELLTRAEMLATTSMSVGLGLTAAALCCIALIKPEDEEDFISKKGSSYSKWVYILMQPVAFVLILIAQALDIKWLVTVQEYGGLIIFFICFGLLLLFDLIKKKATKKKRKGHRR